MCFSATASFSAGILLLGIGALALKSVRSPCEWPMAAVPLLFAFQQLSEGVIWLTFAHEAPRLNAAMTQFYSFFSHALWPAYIPFAILLLEPPGPRRSVLGAFFAAGFLVGAYLLIMMFAFPIVSRPTGQHIEYVAPHFFAATVMTLYLLSTTVSPMFSTHRLLKLFGVLSLLSFGAAYFFYATWFISVWCLFAAILSVIIVLHLRLRDANNARDCVVGGRVNALER